MTAFRWVWSDDPMERTRTTRRSRRRAAALLAAIGLVVSACGSDTTDTTTANTPAGAKENAVGDAVCYDWPAGTIAKPCAIHLKGPGGGRIFYDAGSTQPWGRFLEVAPQKWNPTLEGKLYECPGTYLFFNSCDSDDKNKWPRATGDFGKPTDEVGNPIDDPTQSGDGYVLCDRNATGQLIEERTAIGDGWVNTEELYNDQRCTNGETTGITLAKDYNGGGLTDWYIPSENELLELCQYVKLDSIGGFPNRDHYLSSTLVKSEDNQIYSRARQFDGKCSWTHVGQSGSKASGLVRPIRAF